MKQTIKIFGFVFALVLALIFSGCETNVRTCFDIDGDGYGKNCGLGPDCNDYDRNNWSKCSTCLDDDGDGYYTNCDRYQTINGPDCDDGDGSINPGVPETTCDSVNNDCDAGTQDVTDGDSDGWDVCGAGDAVNPDGKDPADCNDSDPTSYPGAPAPDIWIQPIPLPPVVKAPGGSSIYAWSVTSTCYSYDYDPSGYIDSGVPAVYDFGLGSVNRASPGDNLTIPLNINMGTEDLYSVNITVTYDTSKLEFLGGTGTDANLPAALQGQCEAPGVNEAGGTINFNQVCQANVVTGIKNIANFCFRVLGGTVSAEIGIRPNLIYQEPDPPSGTNITGSLNVFDGSIEIYDACPAEDGVNLNITVETNAPINQTADLTVNGITKYFAPVYAGDPLNYADFSCITIPSGTNTLMATVSDPCGNVGSSDPYIINLSP